MQESHKLPAGIPSLFLLFTLLIILFSVPSGMAQENTRDSVQTSAPTWPNDSLGRRSPRGTVKGFIESAGQGDFARAALYLNLKGTAKKDTSRTGPKIAESLQRLLNKGGNVIPRSLISSDSTGMVNDNLGPELDLVGTATLDGKAIDVLVEKTVGPAGGPIWLVSSATVQQVPSLASEEIFGFTIDRILPDFLINNKWGSVPIGHWLVSLLLAVVAYFLAKFLTGLLVTLIQKFWAKTREPKTAGIIQAFVQPIRIFAALMLFVNINRYLGISLLLRQRFSE